MRMQYTIRNIPKKVDEWLRAKARREKKSRNALVVEILAQSVGVGLGGGGKKLDLSRFAGTMTEEDARTIEEAVRWADERDLSARAGDWHCKTD